MEKKTCCRCRILKPTEEFYHQTSARDGFCPRCKVCESARGGHKKKPVFQGKKLSDTELAYLAGLVDGEGFIGLVKPKNLERAKRHLVYARMSICNTNPKFLSLLPEYGFGVMYLIPARKEHHKDRNDWYVRSNEMKWLLPQLVNYLKIKKEQAILMMKYFSLRRNKSKEYKLQVVEIYNSLRTLNRRGRHGS